MWTVYLRDISTVNRPSDIVLTSDGSIAVLCYGEKYETVGLLLSQDGESLSELKTLEGTVSCELFEDGFIASIYKENSEAEKPSESYAYTLCDWEGSEKWSQQLVGFDNGIVDWLIVDDGYLFSVYVAPGEDERYTKAAMIKLSSDGKYMWEHVYEPADGFQPIYFHLLDAGDDQYLGLGWYSTWEEESIGTYYGIASLLDNNGNTVWHQTYESDHALQLTNGKKTQDGYDFVFEVQDNDEMLVFNGIVAVDQDGTPLSFKSMLVGDVSLFLVKTFAGNDNFWGMGNMTEIIDEKLGDHRSFVYPIVNLSDDSTLSISIHTQ